jgi:hypothetical protein
MDAEVRESVVISDSCSKSQSSSSDGSASHLSIIFFVIGLRLIVIVFWVWVPAAADKATMWLNFHGISNSV